VAVSGRLKRRKKELTLPGGAMPAESRCTAAYKKWVVRLYEDAEAAEKKGGEIAVARLVMKEPEIAPPRRRT
jgi:hypothetical protein